MTAKHTGELDSKDFSAAVSQRYVANSGSSDLRDVYSMLIFAFQKMRLPTSSKSSDSVIGEGGPRRVSVM